MQPMNYMINVKSPFESALTGVQAGVNLSDIMSRSALNEQELAQKRFELQQKQQMQADLAALAAKPQKTAQDFADITAKWPSMAQNFKSTWDMLSSEQQSSRLSQAGQVYAALQSGQPDIAKSLLQQQLDAARNSGIQRDAQSAETMIKLIDLNPAMALDSTGIMLSSILGPEKFATTYSTLAKLPAEVSGLKADVDVKVAEAALKQSSAALNAADTALRQTQTAKARYETENTPQRLTLENQFTAAQIRNLDSQISDRANRFSLDRDRLQSDVELKLYELGLTRDPVLGLNDDAKKIINTAAIESVTATQTAAKMLDLAGRLEAATPMSGVAGKGAEIYKQITGNQDAVTQLRQDYVRLRNTEAVKMLPPGNSSDKDVAIMMQGFPSETADPGTMAAFLRGMAKTEQYVAATASAKAEWINSVGHLGKPRTDIEIDGISVPKGMTFVDFSKAYIAKRTAKNATEGAQTQIPNRSYMRWADPSGGAGRLGTGTFNLPGQ